MPRKKPPPRAIEVRRLYDEGLSRGHVAEETGEDYAFVARWTQYARPGPTPNVGS